MTCYSRGSRLHSAALHTSTGGSFIEVIQGGTHDEVVSHCAATVLWLQFEILQQIHNLGVSTVLCAIGRIISKLILNVPVGTVLE